MVSRRLPPLGALRTFEAAARHRNFTRAADELHVTQTAVSHQVRQLEEWFGKALFVRRGRQMLLTPVGRRLLDGTREALDLLAATTADAMASDADRSLTLSVPPEIAALWLMPRLQSFRCNNPDLDVRIVTEYRRPSFADGVDAALSPGRGRKGEYSERLLLEDELVVCAPSVRDRLPSKEAFYAAPLLSHEGDRHTRLDWSRWIEQLGLDRPPDSVDQADLKWEAPYPAFEAMLDACRRGAGLALVRTTLVAEDLRRGTLVRAFIEILPSDLHLHVIAPSELEQSSKIERLVSWLKDEAARDEALIASG
jgi:LysR family glycine cleavage system transcriptional activator